VVNGAAQNTSSATTYPYIWLGVADDDQELRYTYSIDPATTGEPALTTVVRWEASTNKQLRVVFFANMAGVYNYNGASWSMLGESTSVTSSIGTKYSVRIVLDGTTMKVYRSTGGGLETLIFNLTGVPTYNGAGIHFIVNPNMVASIDNVMMLADDLSQTTTFTPASNNELASASDYNGSTAYAYDARGRMSTETKNSVTKTYSWTMANLLAGVDSSASGDTDVSYFYTGDLKRIWRLENGSLKNTYKWDAGFNVTEEKDWGTSKTKTYAHGLAEVDVTSTPSYAYLTWDHLGSTAGLWDGSIAQTGAWEYTPYGSPYAFAGPSDVTRLYTGHDLDRVSGNYYAPFRTFSPVAGRWLSGDPLGMIDGTNMYGYVRGGPINHFDPNGLFLHILIGAIVGGYVGATTAAPGNRIVGGLSGAFFGGLTAATFGASLLATAIIGGAGGAVGYALSEPRNPTLEGIGKAIVKDGTLSAAGPPLEYIPVVEAAHEDINALMKPHWLDFDFPVIACDAHSH
jgi:RHS repeat-associated protein